ncbi:MAG: MIP/aquaporin family protein [Actinomycetaceae bacterium]|nr:MIP/aquaporin family protein [Actinomycetaceae bacterium]
MTHTLSALLPAVTSAHSPTAWQIFASEFFGTTILLLLGVGVVANNLLRKTKGNNTGFLMVNFAWGFAVMAGVYCAYLTGGHLNPAVTLGKVIMYALDPATTLNGPAIGEGGVAVTFANVCIYIVAQMLGGFVGAVLAWLAYKQHYDEDLDPALKLGTFCTAPEIRNSVWNFVTEFIGTFVLMAWILVSGGTQTATGPLGVALIIVVIGSSLGGPTGYAINPARDLSPRIAHAILPIKGKGGSDWGYAWVPVVAPLAGAMVAPLVVSALQLLP